MAQNDTGNPVPSYIFIIKEFWLTYETKALNPTDVLLYLYLVETCNRNSWSQPFRVSNKKLSVMLDISLKSLHNARTRLIQLGLISYSPGNRNTESPSYSIRAAEPGFHVPFMCKSIGNDNAKTAHERHMNGTRTGILYKTKTIDIRESRERGAWLEDFIQSHAITLDSFCSTQGISPEHFRKTALEVLDEWALIDQPLSDTVECKRHFINHIRTKIQFSKSAENNENPKIGRGGRQTGRSAPTTSPDYGLVD